LTTTEEWEEIADPKDDDGVRRDQWGRYLIVPPQGGEPVAYRRVTTIAKALDTEGSLVPWAQSRVLRGVIESPDVLKALRRLLKDHSDPWYETPERKAEFKQLVSRAASAGGAVVKRDRGTWLHGCAQRHILGLEQLPEFNADDATWLEGFLNTLHDHGIVIDPAYVETIVVHDEFRIAGKADYLQCRIVGRDLPLVGDLKTGDTLEYAMAGFVMQLAIYASADNVYVQDRSADDGSLDQRFPMPPRDLDTALLIHCPQGGNEPNSVWQLDVKAGLEAFQLALDVEAWRRRKAAVPMDPDLTRQLAESLVVVQDRKHRAWLQERIDVIGQDREARTYLSDCWPDDLPLLSQVETHTRAELNEIKELLDTIERQFSIGFGPPEPQPSFDALAYLMAAFPGSTVLTGKTTTEQENGHG
jgi:hypothetical protein